MSNAQDSHYGRLANAVSRRLSKLPESSADLPLALPVLNMYGMKDASEKIFGAGYNVLPIFKDRLNAKTLVTTSNADVIYAISASTDPKRPTEAKKPGNYEEMK